MHKLINLSYCYLIIFQCYSFSISAQKFQFSSGVNLNNFFELQYDDRPYNASDYSSKYGGYFALGFEYMMYDTFPVYLTISYEYLGGKANVRSGGLGGGTAVNVETNKSVVSLGITPFKQKIYKQLNLKIGFVFSVLLKESFSGTKTVAAGNIPINMNLKEVSNSFNSKYYFGIQGAISYDISINNNLILVPHYNYYIGFSDEFKDFPRRTKAMRHSLGIGIMMDL